MANDFKDPWHLDQHFDFYDGTLHTFTHAFSQSLHCLNMIPRKPLSNSNSIPKTAPPVVPALAIKRKELPVNPSTQSTIATLNIAHRHKSLPQTNRRLDEDQDQFVTGRQEHGSALGSKVDILERTSVQTATTKSPATLEERPKASIFEGSSHVNVVDSSKEHASKGSPSAIATLIPNERASKQTRLTLKEVLRYFSLDDLIKEAGRASRKDGSIPLDFTTYVDLLVQEGTLLESLESNISHLLRWFPRSFPSPVRELVNAIDDNDAGGPEIFIAVVNSVKKAKQGEVAQGEAKQNEIQQDELKQDEAKQYKAKQDESGNDGKGLSKRQKKPQKKQMDKQKKKQEGKEEHTETNRCANLIGDDIYVQFLTSVKEEKLTRDDALYLVDAVRTAITDQQKAKVKETDHLQVKVLQSAYVLQRLKSLTVPFADWEWELREITNSEVLWYSTTDKRPPHPNHHRNWYSKNLWCTDCKMICGVCGKPCCAFVEASRQGLQITEAEKVKNRAVLAEIKKWIVYPRDESTFLECEDCHKVVCPNCSGICPNTICQSKCCIECIPEPFTECFWHHENVLSVVENQVEADVAL